MLTKAQVSLLDAAEVAYRESKQLHRESARFDGAMHSRTSISSAMLLMGGLERVECLSMRGRHEDKAT